jgi:hypothetical protein
LLVERQQIEVTNVDPYEDATSAEEVLIKVVEHCGIEAAVVLAAALKLDYDEAAIRAMCNAGNAGKAGNGQHMIEWKPPKADPKRDL